MCRGGWSYFQLVARDAKLIGVTELQALISASGKCVVVGVDESSTQQNFDLHVG